MLTAGPLHVWEKQELTFTAVNTYKNPYTDVIVWVDLNGPGFTRANTFFSSNLRK